MLYFIYIYINLYIYYYYNGEKCDPILYCNTWPPVVGRRNNFRYRYNTLRSVPPFTVLFSSIEDIALYTFKSFNFIIVHIDLELLLIYL